MVHLAAAEPVQPAAPHRSLEELVQAFDDLHEQCRDISARAEPIIAGYLVWFATTEYEDDDAAAIDGPAEIIGPYQELDNLVAFAIEDRQELLQEWDAAGFNAQLPDHGLPLNSHLGRSFELQRPTPMTPEAHLARLQDEFATLGHWGARLMHDEEQLNAQIGPNGPEGDMIDRLAELEESYESLLLNRQELIGEWDEAGLGEAIPPHGLNAAAGAHLQIFDRVDHDRIDAIRARARADR